MKTEEATKWLTNLKKDIGKLEHKHLWHYEQAFDEIIKLLSNQQKTGEWVGEADGYADGELVYDVWYCSQCDYCIETDNQEELPKYCPNCGARMGL